MENACLLVAGENPQPKTLVAHFTKLPQIHSILYIVGYIDAVSISTFPRIADDSSTFNQSVLKEIHHVST